jgi:hypothetical protein
MDTAQIIFAALFPVAAMSIAITAIVAHHKRKVEEMRLGSHRSAKDGAAYTELEERMRILERIVTDKGFDVAHQIEALRDTHPVEASLEDRRAMERSK